jgi:hypothetical protein
LKYEEYLTALNLRRLFFTHRSEKLISHMVDTYLSLMFGGCIGPKLAEVKNQPTGFSVSIAPNSSEMY